MWDGVFSPQWKKAVTHESHAEFEVTEVVDGFAQVKVYFNHECVHDGKHTTPPSNEIGYEYEIEVSDDMDETDVKNDIETLLGDGGTADLIEILESY